MSLISGDSGITSDSLLLVSFSSDVSFSSSSVVSSSLSELTVFPKKPVILDCDLVSSCSVLGGLRPLSAILDALRVDMVDVVVSLGVATSSSCCSLSRKRDTCVIGRDVTRFSLPPCDETVSFLSLRRTAGSVGLLGILGTSFSAAIGHVIYALLFDKARRHIFSFVQCDLWWPS